ncbi:MAG: hypothetical protein KIT60_06615 [Burkholderiaceae bacterium]|nr:hypothetical protein [Burkholderiaceae bacterium]
MNIDASDLRIPLPLETRRRWLLMAASGLVTTACGGGGGDAPAPAPSPIPTLPRPPVVPVDGPAWPGFAGNAQHTAVGAVSAQRMDGIYWHMPVDLAPQLSATGSLLTHYGSPVITRHDTVIVPVKTGADGGFRIEARVGATGDLKWMLDSTYLLPPHRWVPSFNPTLTPDGRVWMPEAGGRVLVRSNAGDPGDPAATITRIAFYGDAAYAANAAAFDATVFINTPLTSDTAGNVYFGFVVTGANPAGLGGGGIVRIAADGTPTFVTVAAALPPSAGPTKTATNAAPALSNDGSTLYVLVNNVPPPNVRPSGRLLALDAATLATQAHVALVDPASGQPSRISDDATSSPLVAPDGDVYIGVLEAPDSSHNFRGWLLHFNAALTQAKTPGSFGWDNTPSIVPASVLGTPGYLLLTKYNNYAPRADGLNRIAILDPNSTQPDPVIAGVQVMHEVITQLGPTPDPANPGGVKEWCVNTAAVDPSTQAVLINSEDGILYRWHLPTNTFTQQVTLNPGRFQSYTPTALGPDGRIYSINNATLHSVGQRV